MSTTTRSATTTEQFSPLTRRRLRTVALRTLPALVAGAVLIGSAPASATPAISAEAAVRLAPAPTTQGIIMRDGGICDPIRHMGC